jgi:hypothetical protein
MTVGLMRVVAGCPVWYPWMGCGYGGYLRSAAMRVYLVQHGEAVAKDVDAERPLTEKGAEDVKKVAEF